MTETATAPTALMVSKVEHQEKATLLIRALSARISNAITMRADLLKTVIDTRRDLNKECGYPDEINLEQYRLMYERGDIASRVVDIMPEECWQLDPDVFEEEGVDETPFEKQWERLVKKFNLYSQMELADKASLTGRFSLLLIGIDDGKDLSAPVDGVDDMSDLDDLLAPDDEEGETNESSEKPERKILFFRTFPEYLVQVQSIEQDVKSPRFGLPTSYTVKFADPTMENGGYANTPGLDFRDVRVHWSRVVHIPGDTCMSSPIYSAPKMKRVFNRLADLAKIQGGSSEMFYRGAFPGFSFEVNPDIASSADLDTESMREEFEKYSNSLQRYLAVVGAEVKQLAPQVADPLNHWEMNIKSVCIAIGVPWRVFVGSEQAQLASSQDKRSWNSRVKRRQTRRCDPEIVRPVARRLIAMKALTRPKQLVCNWPDLNAPTDEDRAAVFDKFVSALAKYVQGGVDAVIPPLELLVEIAGFDITRANKMIEQSKVGEIKGDRLLRDFGLDPAGATPGNGSVQPASKGTAKISRTPGKGRNKPATGNRTKFDAKGPKGRPVTNSDGAPPALP